MTTQTKTKTKPAQPRPKRKASTQPAKPRLSARNRAAIRLLESWMNDATPEEIEDQRETLALLQRTRQEYPLSFRRVEFDDKENEAP